MPINRKKIDEKLIRLSRFSEVGPYSGAYLSLLVQRKKLKAKKVGRNYFTSLAWFNEYLDKHAYGDKVEFNQEKLAQLLNYQPEVSKVEIKTVEAKKEFLTKNKLNAFWDILAGRSKPIIASLVSLVLVSLVLFIVITPGASAELAGLINKSADSINKNFFNAVKISKKQIPSKMNLAAENISIIKNKTFEFSSLLAEDIARRNKILAKKKNIFTEKINISFLNFVHARQNDFNQIQSGGILAGSKIINQLRGAGNSVAGAYGDLENNLSGLKVKIEYNFNLGKSDLNDVADKISQAYTGSIQNIKERNLILTKKINNSFLYFQKSLAQAAFQSTSSFNKIITHARSGVLITKNSLIVFKEDSLNFLSSQGSNLGSGLKVGGELLSKKAGHVLAWVESRPVYFGNFFIDAGDDIAKIAQEYFNYLNKIAGNTRNRIALAAKKYLKIIFDRADLARNDASIFFEAGKNNLDKTRTNLIFGAGKVKSGIAEFKTRAQEKFELTFNNIRFAFGRAEGGLNLKLVAAGEKKIKISNRVKANTYELADNINAGIDSVVSLASANSNKILKNFIGLKKEISNRNRILVRRVLFVGEKIGQASGFLADSVFEKLRQAKNLALEATKETKAVYNNLKILSKNAMANEKKELSLLFKNFSLIKNRQLGRGINGSAKQGRVLGVEEKESENKVYFNFIKVIKNTQAKINLALNQTTNALSDALEMLSQKQNNLSIVLGNKAVDLSYDSAGKIKGISESGSKKISLVGDAINETNQSIGGYSQEGKKTFDRELTRSLWSLNDLYIKIIDFFIPKSLKTQYAGLYTPENNTSSGKTDLAGAQTEPKTIAPEKIVEIRTEKIIEKTIEKTIVEKLVENNSNTVNQNNTSPSSPSPANPAPVPDDLVLNNLLVKNNLEVQGELKIAGLKLDNLQVNGQLKIGNYILPAGAGINGQVLKIGGDGKVYWGEDIIGGGGGGTVVTNSGGGGTVTSIDMTVPAGLSVAGGPITSDGTLALSLASGYIIPLVASSTNWNDFYLTPSNRIAAGTGLSWAGNTLNAAAQNINQLGQIGDVSTTTLVYGSVLRWNGLSAWESVATSSLGILSSQWTTAGSDIYYNTGNVGIGTVNPLSLLSVGSTSQFQVNALGYATSTDLALTGLSGSIISSDSIKTSIQELDESIYKMSQSGFDAWTSGTSADTYTIIDGKFQIDRAGDGFIKGKKISWTAGLQTGVLTASSTSWIYIDTDGLLKAATSFPANKIILFEVLYDGTTYNVVKENHPYAFGTAVSSYLHNNAGTTIRGTGAIITRVAAGTGASADDRRIKIVGADTLDDHGLSTSISAVEPAIFNIYHRASSGKWSRYAQQSELPAVYNSGPGTVTALDAVNAYSVYVLYVSKDDIESTNPPYYATMGETAYTSLADAQAAISSGAVIFASNELDSLEFAQLGYVVAQYSVAGGYINELQVLKSTFNQQLVGGSAGSDHGLLTGLLDDDHSQYALLAGRNSGQIMTGGLNGNETLTLRGNIGDSNTLTNANLNFMVGDGGLNTAMTILNNGHVGIGTSSPYSKLSVWGSGTGGLSTFSVMNSASSTLFTVLDNGNVGIGTSSPWQALAINGNLALTGGIYDKNNSLGTNGYIMQSDGSNSYWVATSSLGLLTTYVTEGTNLYYTDARARDALSSTAVGLTYTGGSGIFSLTSGYNIPLTASSTDWNTAYLNRIISATSPLQISSNNLGLASGYNIPLTASSTNWNDFYLTPSNRISAGTGLSWAGNTLNAAAQNINQLGQIGDVSTSTLAYGSVLRWNGLNVWESVATSTLKVALSDTTGTLDVDRGGTGLTAYTKNQLLFASDTGVIGQIATSSLGLLTTNVAEGSNLYYTDTRARTSLSSTALGLTYTGATGVFSLTSGYNIPLTASTTNWNAFYDTPSNRITAGAGLSWSGNSLSTTNGFTNYGALGSLAYYPANGTTATGTAASKIFWDDSNGRLGIGTTAPGYPLHVVSANVVSMFERTSSETNSWLTGAALKQTTTGDMTDGFGAGFNFAIQDSAGVNNYIGGFGAIRDGADNSGKLFFGTYSAGIYDHKMVIDKTGNVGIGTTTPNQKLSIFNNAADSAIEFSSATGANYKWSMGLDYTDGSFRIASSSALGTSDRLVIDGGGNVGIGDASPASLFTVGSGDLFQVNSSGYALHPLGAVATPSISFAADPNTGLWSSGADTLNFSSAGIERGRFTSAGKFGIGSTSPDSLLTVYSDGSQTGGLFHIATSSTEVLYASALGNIGIGVTYPNAKLEVMSASTQLKLSYNDSTYGTITTDSSGLLTLTGNSGVGGNVIIASSSRLALGTTTPDSLFYILQNGAMDAPLMRIASSTDAGLNNYLLVDSNGKLAVGSSFSSVLFNVGSSTPNHVSGYRDSFMSGAFEIDDLLYIDGTGTSTIAGNLSIANSLAADRLTIGGPNLIIESSGTITRGTWHGTDINISDYTNLSLSATGLTLANSTISLDSNYSIPLLASTTEWNSFYISPSSRIDAGTGLSWSGNTLNTTNGIINSGTAGSLAYYNTAGTTLSATQDWQLFWDGIKGNLSIGTSTPSSKLSVWGDEGSLMTVFNVMDHASSTLFTILGNGNVGMGTTSPVALLDMVKTQDLPSVISISNFNASASSSAGIITNSDTASGGFLTYSSLSAASSLANTSFLYSYTNASGGLMLDTEAAAPIRFATNGYANERMRISSDGKVGIGTSSPTYQLSVTKTSPAENEIIFGISTSTAGTIFTVDEDGDIAYDGTASSPAADYAEYFFTHDLDLAAGETVCVDTAEKNAVKRCSEGADGNVMGIVSTKPAIIGNSQKNYEINPNYVVVGMLGQVPAKVSAENGPIRPGDSLTSASSTPGYAMRADAGDSTVGVALEPLAEGKGKINVLISRRNKSLTVEEVEDKVTERVAAMEIEDEVNILIASAIDKLNLDDEVNENVDPKLLLLESKLTVQTDSITGRIAGVEKSISDIAGILHFVQNDIMNMDSRLAAIENWKAEVATGTSSISQLSSLYIDNLGNVKIGRGAQEAESYGDTSASSTAEIASVEVVSLNDTDQTAFVVNQEGAGDIVDFKKDQVSIMNINSEGNVTVAGNLFVSGKIMACSGSACGEALDLAVDETMGDIGVEGKVVAGAFEGYCEDGFIWVPGNNKYGTMPGFCVMGGQAKSNSNHTPATPSPEGTLWVDVSQGEAQLACQSLGSDYHLLSENEWLTIASNIIKNSANDQDDSSEGLQLKTDSLSYPSEYILTNKNTIKEFGQGIGEWTDKIVTKSGCPKLASANNWNEYTDVLDYYGLDIAPAYYLTDKNNSIGLIRNEENTDNIRGFVRGLNGIYSLDLSYSPTYATSTIGFRCAK